MTIFGKKNKPGKKTARLLFALSIILSFQPLIGQINVSERDQVERKWFQIAGDWITSAENDITYATNTRNNPYPYNHSELLNNHTLISLHPFQFDTLKTSVNVSSPRTTNSTFSVFFNVTDDFKKFKAIRLTADNRAFTKIELISSDIKDPLASSKIRGNFVISVIDTSTIEQPFFEPFSLEIKLKNGLCIVALNGKEVLKSAIGELNSESKFGFYHSKNTPRIYSFIALSKKKIVFTDDFSKNTLTRTTVNATIEKK